MKNKTISYDLEDLKKDPTWQIILRRQDGSENFNRHWSDYRQGFGTPSGEYFIGLDKLNELTTLRSQELLLILEDFENRTRYAYYDRFAVADEQQNYKLMLLGNYHGDAGDALRNHVNAMFSTKDQDNDRWSLNCADTFKGGWWFTNCFTG